MVCSRDEKAEGGRVLMCACQIAFIHGALSLSPDVRTQEWFSNVEEISKEKARILDQLVSQKSVRWPRKAKLLFHVFIPNRGPVGRG